MIVILIYFFYIFFINSILLSQEQKKFYPLIFDELLLRKKVAENPHIIKDYISYENKIKLLIDRQNLEKIITKTDTLIDGKRIIPVVVHVIHTYGTNNISDAQVIDAIEKLNIDFQKKNPDTSLTYYLFKQRAANCSLEFRLAKRDPYGNCTNGINKIFDYETNWAYFNTMKKYVWPPDKYMNVFVVSYIYPEGMVLPEGAFIGGMSPFPPDNPLTQLLTGGDPDIDGVLIRHDCIGTIGTATNAGGMGINLVNRPFTHEVGHYLNLYHTFQNLMFNLLPAPSGCPSFLAPNGDEVDDTPPVDKATQNTSLLCFEPGSINTCFETPDEPDMIENYMDYQWGYCQNIFTLGQKARMDVTLNNYRKNLWSLENLIFTGVLDTTPTICSPIADFYSNINITCPGNSVNFYNSSFNGPVEYILWHFPGGEPPTSTSLNPTVTYNSPGIYDVTLTVGNSSGENTITKNGFIKVIDPQTIKPAPYYESFENYLDTNYIIKNQGGNSWEITDTAAASGFKSLRILNFTGNPPNSIDEFISYGINLTSLQSTSVPLKLKFKYAYAGKIIPGTLLTEQDTAYDALKIYVSKNCGLTWQLKWNKSGQSLQTTNPTSSSFKPLPSDWKEDSINIQIFLTQQVSNFLFKFEFKSNGGNNIYIDDIIIDNSLTNIPITINNSLLYSIHSQNNLYTLKLTINDPSYLSIKLYNYTGQLIKNIKDYSYFTPGTYEFLITNHNTKQGFYLLRIQHNNNFMSLPIIVK